MLSLKSTPKIAEILSARIETNHLFSVEVITDNAGALVETYDYDSHGALTIKDGAGVVLSASSVGNAYGFTGRRLDVESGLYYFRARYFDVGLGRFVSRDPGREVIQQSPNRFMPIASGKSVYGDGYNSYFNYFSPNHLDPSGRFLVRPRRYGDKVTQTYSYTFNVGCHARCGERDVVQYTAESFWGEFEWFIVRDPDGTMKAGIFQIPDADALTCKLECDLSGKTLGNGELKKKAGVKFELTWEWNWGLISDFWFAKEKTWFCKPKVMLDTSDQCKCEEKEESSSASSSTSGSN